MVINMYLETTLLIQKMIEWHFIANLKKFKMGLFLSMIINSAFSVCGGIGMQEDAVDFALSTSVKLSDCYKKIVKDLCDFSSTWTGFEAKIIDECV